MWSIRKQNTNTLNLVEEVKQQNLNQLQTSLAKEKTTYIMVFPEWLSVGDSEESDANLNEEESTQNH